jgi:hypothetical protein
VQTIYVVYGDQHFAVIILNALKAVHQNDVVQTAPAVWHGAFATPTIGPN